MYKALIFLWDLGLILIIAFATFASALTLEQASEKVRQDNRDVKAAQLDWEAAKEKDRASRGRYYPDVSVRSRYTRLDDDVVIDVASKRIERDILGGPLSVAIDVDPPPVKVREKDIFNAHVFLKQPLYTGGRISAGMGAADAERRQASLKQSMTLDEVLANVWIRYFQVRLSERVVAILRDVEQQLSALEEMATTLVETGMTARYSVLQIQVAQADLAAKKRLAIGQSELARLALKSQLALPPAAPLNLHDKLTTLPLRDRQHTFVQQSLKLRKEVPWLRQKKTQVQMLKQAETGAMLPMVYGFGKYELLPEQLTALEPKWAVGVGLDIPITAGLRQFPKRRRAALLAKKVEVLIQKAQQDIPLQVEKFYTAAESRWQAMQAVEKGVRVAEEALRLARLRFKNGKSTSLEVIQSSTDLEKMRIKRWQTLEDYNRQLIRLYHASGDVSQYLGLYRSKA